MIIYGVLISMYSNPLESILGYSANFARFLLRNLLAQND